MRSYGLAQSWPLWLAALCGLQACEPRPVSGGHRVGGPPRVLERGGTYEIVENETGELVYRTGGIAPWLYEPSSGSYQPYVYELTPAQEAVIRTALIGARFADDHVSFSDELGLQTRVPEERWYLEHDGVVVPLAITAQVVNEGALEVSHTSWFDTSVGQGSILYIFRAGEPLKHEVRFLAAAPGEYRLVQEWRGVSFDAVRMWRPGGDVVSATSFSGTVSSDPTLPRRFELSRQGRLVVHEDARSAGDKFHGVELDAAAGRAAFTWGSWSLQAGEMLLLDPDTHTATTTGGLDGHITTDSAAGASCPSGSYTKDTSSTAVTLGVPDDTGGACQRAFFEWDITAIPDTADVTGVVLKYEVTAVTSPVNCDYTELGAQPSSGAAADVWTDIGDGTVFVSGDAACTTTGTNKSVDLGASAATDVEAQLSANWFGVGVKASSEARDASSAHTTSLGTADGTPTPVPTVEITFTSPPSVSSFSDTPDPVAAGSAVTLQLDWLDYSNEQLKVHFCKTNAVTASATGGACSGDTWASSASLASTDPRQETYTTTAADRGTQTYYAFVCDDDSTCSGTTGNSGTFTVDNRSPAVTVATTDGSDGTTPTSAGAAVTFTATATDADSDTWKLIVCKSNAVTAGADPDCPGGVWCEDGTARASGAASSCSYTTLAGDAESNGWFAFACDTYAGQPRCSAADSAASPFKVNHAPSFTAVADAPDPLFAGDTLTLTSTASDGDTDTAADTVKLFVCQAADATASGCGAGGSWCGAALTASDPTCNFTVPGTRGTYSYYAYVFDSHDLASAANPRSGTFTVDNHSPSITVATTDGSDGTTPTHVGAAVSFAATATDADSDTWKLIVCKTNAVTPGANPDCPGGTYCEDATARASGVASSCSYTALTSDAESNAWFAFACDTHAGAPRCSAVDSGASPFKVNHVPSFTAFADSPDPLFAGETLTMSSTAADGDTDTAADTVKLFVCQDADATAAGCGAGGSWCSAGLTASNPSCNFSVPGTRGSYTYDAYVFDSHDLPAADNPRSGTFTVDNHTPVITVATTDGSDGTTPTGAGAAVSFTATATDDDSDTWRLIVCQTNAVTAGADPDCPGGVWCEDATARASGVASSCSYTTLLGEPESNAWYAFACDTYAAQPRCSAVDSAASPFKVNHAPSFAAVADAPDPLLGGATVTVTTTASDADTDTAADTVKLFVCQAADATASGCGAGGAWCSAGLTASNPTCNFAAPASSGANAYYAYVFDNHDRPATSNPRSGSFVSDVDPPTGSVSINGGAATATGRSVVLALTYADVGAGVQSVRYTNDGVFDSEPWESASATKLWTLTAGDGTKTVYYQVRDLLNQTVTVSDTIDLDGTARLSVASDGTAANGLSELVVLSEDGAQVAFASVATNLIAGDTAGVQDVFVRDRDSDGDGILDEAGGVATRRLSVATDGTEGNGDSHSPSISADGRYVVFSSKASNLVADTNAVQDIFVRDRDTDADGIFDEAGDVSTTRVSLGVNGEANAVSFNPMVSGNGRYVAFASASFNLLATDANDGAPDIFVRDLVSSATIVVSIASDGTQANAPSLGCAISGSGRHIAFVSGATNLVADDTGYSDVFVHDRDSDGDSNFDQFGMVSTVRVSSLSTGLQANGSSDMPAISEDGRFVFFFSGASDLVGSDTNGVGDIFVHDRDTDADGTFDESGFVATRRVSVASDGTQANGSSFYYVVSADGRYVVFASLASNLVAGDTNGVSDIFLRDRDVSNDGTFDTAGDVSTVRVSTDGATQGNGASDKPAISGDGRWLGYSSAATNLIAGDTNGTTDIFVYEP